MKVYAVIEKCEDNFYPHYVIIDDCVYLNEEDAKKRLEEVIKGSNYLPEQFEIYDFEVKE